MRLESGWKSKTEESGPRRRGPAGQLDGRVAERAVRVAAVAFTRWAAVGHVEMDGVARALGIAPRTLRDWERGWEEDRLEGVPRGRPAERSDRELRNFVILILNLMGPETGVPILQAIFPQMPRREVEDLVGRYKRLYAKKSELELMTLRWLRPGRVWAMDHADPSKPIDGVYPVAFAVRDLPSSEQLEWGGLPSQETRPARDILESLFVQHGPPLVLKADNGSPFTSEEMREFLRRWAVVLLLSPKETPEYNGSCEAGIGSMKRRTHIEAARNSRPGFWSSDDLEAARRQANETGRPWGPTKGTPEEAWAGRDPIPESERKYFAEDLMYYREKVRKEKGYLFDTAIDRDTAARIEREAVGRTLVARGLLEIRRKRVPLPLKRLFSAKIS